MITAGSLVKCIDEGPSGLLKLDQTYRVVAVSWSIAGLRYVELDAHPELQFLASRFEVIK